MAPGNDPRSPPPAPAPDPGSDGGSDFAAIYERHFDGVCRWLRAMGAPYGDLEDLAQEVFLVARRKHGDFRGDNIAGWLYGIAWRVASDARRRAWFRRWARGSGDTLDELPSLALSPAELLERREAREILHALLSRMNPRLRAVFVLAEIEGCSTEEIAELEQTKVPTVWTRLHRARREFVAMVARLQAKEQRLDRPRRPAAAATKPLLPASAVAVAAPARPAARGPVPAPTPSPTKVQNG